VAVSRIRKVASTLRSWAKECSAQNRDRTVALVVHGDFINYLLQILLEMGPDADADVRKAMFHSYNTALHLVDIFGDDDERRSSASVLFHNNVEHLVGVEKMLCKLDMIGRV